MRIANLVLAIVLAASATGLVVPVAAADTCASKVLENTVCTAVGTVYCVTGYVKEALICEQGVLENCVDSCWDDLPDAIAFGEIDLRWLTSCPGPWGHEERTKVGPVTVVTYECDDGGA